MHKFGVLSLLFKHKVLVAIENGEVALWEDVKFRPIISVYNNIYKSWYTHAGRAIMLLAKIYYWRSDIVTNMMANRNVVKLSPDKIFLECT